MLAIVGGAAKDANMQKSRRVPHKTQVKIREFAEVFAVMMLVLEPDYNFARSKLANSDLSITDIRCRAAALSRALESMRRSSTSW